METGLFHVGITINLCYLIFVKYAKPVEFWSCSILLVLFNIGLIISISKISEWNKNLGYAIPYCLLLIGCVVQGSTTALDWIKFQRQQEDDEDDEATIRRVVRHWHAFGMSRRRVENIVREYGYFPERELRQICYDNRDLDQQKRKDLIEIYISTMENALPNQ